MTKNKLGDNSPKDVSDALLAAMRAGAALAVPGSRLEREVAAALGVEPLLVAMLSSLGGYECEVGDGSFMGGRVKFGFELTLEGNATCVATRVMVAWSSMNTEDVADAVAAADTNRDLALKAARIRAAMNAALPSWSSLDDKDLAVYMEARSLIRAELDGVSTQVHAYLKEKRAAAVAS